MATTALAVPQGLGADIEKVLIGGDLSPLNPDQRLRFYNAMCESLGLNPLTKPFAYIMLNGKLQLYALKDCTEQLRKIHGVSITNVDPKQVGDLLVVVASASDREGRTDSATGAVSLGGLKGEALANAMMKAETKAKRRVTLSLCGLGMLDETEIQTLREQGVAAEPQGNTWTAPQAPVSGAVNSTQAVQNTVTETRPQGNAWQAPQTPVQVTQEFAQATRINPPAETSPISDGEPDIRPKSQRGNPTMAQGGVGESSTTTGPKTNTSTSQATPSNPQGEVVGAEPSITVPQGKRFFAIAKSAGLSDEQVKQRLASIGLHCHRDSIPKSRYNAAVDAIDNEFKFHTRS